MNKYFVTTPIYYINDVPHIGHTCTTVAADIIARLHRQIGDKVFFLTGTDEHGQKIAESAQKEGLDPKIYCDKIAPTFIDAWKSLNISNDFFIRTTDPRHEKVVGEVLQNIHAAGDVYKAKYEGYYCVGCEKFLTETDLINNHCPLHPAKQTIKKSEENWFFKLSRYVPRLIKLIEEENYIFPEGKRSEVLAKLKGGVPDISLSRESVEWGIPLPWDRTQTVYVWFDALINYYSATQFVEGKSDFWPADLHLLGKEILWFHTVIWQAMLLSAGIKLPKRTYIHSFYMIDGQKMSKSLGNVISPKQLVDIFGVDGARYLIARSFPAENDSDVGIIRFKERYNADLANNLGNLLSRVARLNEESRIRYADFKCILSDEYIKLIDDFKFGDALDYVFKYFINAANIHLNNEAPWKLEPNDHTRDEVVAECINYLLKAAFYLQPIIPTAANTIISLFTGKINNLNQPLFPRVEVVKENPNQLINKIIVGKITTIEKLADKTIQRITVNIGQKELKIVCSDLSLKIGELVPVALPGAQVSSPKGGKVKIKKSKVHGYESEAMLCSALELGRGTDHEKIMRTEGRVGEEVEVK